MSTHVVVLGAGFGGLELTTRLSQEFGDEIRITLIDQNDYFVFGFSKLDVMFGRRNPNEVRHHYGDIVKPGVEFKHERIESIDPTTRLITTNESTYEADVLVVALGADLDLEATPGLLEVGNEFYTVEGAERLREVLPEFKGGTALVAVLGTFYKCPPAPSEAALLLHDYVKTRGLADATDIRVLSPLPSPLPVSEQVAQNILSAFHERDIDFFPQTWVTRIDANGPSAILNDGRAIPFDLFLGIPVHIAPPVVESSGLAEGGWIPVDTATFVTKFPDVYAIGDVTSAPVPKAGVFAEGQAGTLADHLIPKIRGQDGSSPYEGVASCYLEFGGEAVARVDVEFLTGPAPTATFRAPSLEIKDEKAAFASTRRARWFDNS